MVHWSPVRLLNQTFFVDDEHAILPRDTANCFYEIEETLPYLAIAWNMPHTCARRKKIMLCTSAWLEEFYCKPFHYLSEKARSPNSTLLLTNIPTGSAETLHCTHCTGQVEDACACDSGCPTVFGRSMCRAIHTGYHARGVPLATTFMVNASAADAVQNTTLIYARHVTTKMSMTLAMSLK